MSLDDIAVAHFVLGADELQKVYLNVYYHTAAY